MIEGATDTSQQDFQDLKKKSLKGMSALFVRQVLVKVIFFAGNIVLARLLAPQIFGIYAIVQFVVQFFSTFGDVGIGAALIQKKGDLSREELSTTFWLQQMLVWIVVVVVVLAAPLALKVYPTLPPVGVWLIRAMAVSFLFSSLKTIPAILMERDIDFKRIAWVDITENLAFQVVAISCAYMGFEVWSFILAAIARSMLGAVLIYALSPWRPSFHYRFEAVKGLVEFGLPYQGNQVLCFIKDAVTPLFVGAYAGAAAVGYVNWARTFAFVPLMVSETFGRVAFPAFSKLQDDKELLTITIERSIRMMTFFMLPVTAGIIALAPEITHVVYTDKWLPAMGAFYLFSATPLLMGVTLPMFSGILSLGKSNIILAMNVVLIVIEWGIGASLVLKFGFVWIAVTQPISYVLFAFIYKRVLRMHNVKVNIIPNVIHSALVSTVMAISVIYAKRLLVTGLMSICLCSLFGILIYFCLSCLVNRQILREAKIILSSFIGLHMLKSAIKNRLIVYIDPELRLIAKIIRETTAHGIQQNPVSLECDQIFLERLRRNPMALKMKSWEQHFELNGFTEYPEIQGIILDFGCGSGHLDLVLARRGFTLTGVDLSPVGIAIASYIRGQESEDVKQRVSFLLADVTVDSPLGEKFDSIWSAHVFEHIQDPTRIFQGLRRWIKPGGYLLISVPFGYAFDDPSHVNHFKSEEELRDFLKNHVIIERIKVHRDQDVIRALCKF